MIELRDYQRDAIDKVNAAMAQGSRGTFLVMPTGAGKTVCFTSIIRDTVEAGGRCVILAHRQELIQQAGRSLDAFGLVHGVIKAGDSTFPAAPVQVCSIDSMKTRALPWVPDLIVIDEAHLAKAERYTGFLAKYPGARRLLVSATPIRQDGSGFDDLADTLIVGATISELIARGYLVPPVVYATEPIEGLAGVKKVAGDYAVGALEKLMTRTQLIGDVVKSYKAKADGRKGVVFCVGIRHSEMVAGYFNHKGIKAEHLDGTMSPEQRRAILGRLKTGETTIVCNAQVLCEGWDEPSISYIGMARPTKSLALYIQQGGRGLRTSPGKSDCVIIDHGRNTWEHGGLTDDRPWSLYGDGEVIRTRKRPKECLICAAYLPKSAIECQYCGYVYPVRLPDVIEGDLVALNARVEKPAASPLHLEYRALVKSAILKGRKPGWAYYKLKDRYLETPEVVTKGLTYGDSQRIIREVQDEMQQLVGVTGV